MVGVLLLAILLVGLAATVRYGVLLPQARQMIEDRISGLPVSRFGALQVQGLRGDLWRHFTLHRLAIADQSGVWVEVTDLDVAWSPQELLSRRLHVTDLRAGQVRVLRRPVLTAAQPPQPMPVSVQLDRIRTRVEMLPAFSYQRGAYTLDAGLAVRRQGGAAGRVHADSLMHDGDLLDVRFDLGRSQVLQLRAHALEAHGGALAGALGLAPDQPFQLDATAEGRTSQGRFTVDSRSGALTPVQASGAWTADGGQARGVVLLSSSRLLRQLAAMFGPSARFDIAGRRAPAGLYDLDARIASENLQLTAAGQADIGRQLTGPAGLAVDFTVGRLSRLLTWPQMAGGRARGRLVGNAARWTFTGNASVDSPSAEGFTLTRISGPVTVVQHAGEVSVEARATGEGGRGSGLLAALLGARPAAQITSVFLPDGRMLLRRVILQGPGVSIDGAGQRGILGDLAFRGTARLSNFAFAWPAAHGLVEASWSAGQGRGTDPWRFTVDARGQRFAMGLAELDRLMGGSPHFVAAGDISPAGVSLSRAALDGDAGSVTGNGRIGSAGALEMALVWRARGPFRAGPVELSGDINGAGRVSGTLLHPRADLTASLATVDMPVLPLRDARLTLSFLRGADNIDGLVSLTATSLYGPARGSGAFDFRPGGLALTHVDLDAGGVTAQGSISLTRGRPSLADLTYTIRPGALLLAGSASGRANIAETAAGPAGRITLQANDAVTRGGFAAHFLSVEAEGPLDHLGLKLSGQSALADLWRFAGTGQMAQVADGYDISLQLGGRIRRADFRSSEALVHLGQDRQTARLRLAMGAGSAELDLVQAAQSLNAHAVLRGADLGLVNEDLAGQFDADITLAGQGPSLSGDMVANLQDARAAGSRDPARIGARLRAHLAGDSITLDATAQDNQGLHSQANLVLPAESAANPFRIAIARTRPMSGTFSAQGEIGSLWTLLMGSERSLAGQVDMSGRLSGTLADPRATGEATLSGGRFTDSGTGLRLTNVSFRADLANNAIEVADLQGADGARGRLSGAGRISLLRNGVSNFRLDLQGFRLLDNDIGEVSASGQTTINRDATGRVQLSGALVVDRAEIAANPPTPTGVAAMDVTEVNQPAKSGPVMSWEHPRTNALAVALDIDLRAPRGVFVRGRGLNLELAVDSHVDGTTSNPTLTGTARVVRGDYDLAGRRFQFDTRGVITLSTRPEQIRLDLTATRDDPSLTAVVKITGTAARPRIELTSTPALPQDEVLSRVLFGSSAAQLSPFEAAQLASSLAALAGGGGFDVIGNLRNLANLDRLAIGGTQVTGVTVSGGRYINDNVYVELTGGGREGPSAQVEWRARRNLSIISRLRSQGDASISVRWRRDY